MSASNEILLEQIAQVDVAIKEASARNEIEAVLNLKANRQLLMQQLIASQKTLNENHNVIYG